MNKYYIVYNGMIMSTGFDTIEQCRTYAKEGGFDHAFIIQILEQL